MENANKYTIKYIHISIETETLEAESMGKAIGKFKSLHRTSENDIYHILNTVHTPSVTEDEVIVNQAQREAAEAAKMAALTSEDVAKVFAGNSNQAGFEPEGEDSIEFDDIVLTKSTKSIVCGDTKSSISDREIAVLECLIQMYPAPLTTSELTYMIKSWRSISTDSKAVTTTVSRVRKKLKKIGSKCEIEFLRDKGYAIFKSNDD